MIKIGIEIEGVFNGNYTPEEIGEYHESERLNNFWNVERDSSINRSFIFDEEEKIEYISNILYSEEELKKALISFRNSFGSKKQLNKLMYFNKSCGCHIHFGLEKKFFYKVIPYDLLIKTRNYFFKELNNSDLRKELKDSVKKQYFRSYAMKLKKEAYNKGYTPRYCEFNVSSEKQGRGLEWRSFNLRNVETWKEFNKMFEIMFKTSQYLYNLFYEGYSFKKSLRIERKLLKECIEEKKTNEIINKPLIYEYETTQQPLRIMEIGNEIIKEEIIIK